MSNINPFTEIGAIVVAVVLAIMGGLLLYAGKIDTAFASSMFILAAGLLGINGALKAPSQQQQQQLGALAQQGQALTSHALSVLPTVVAHGIPGPSSIHDGCIAYGASNRPTPERTTQRIPDVQRQCSRVRWPGRSLPAYLMCTWCGYHPPATQRHRVLAPVSHGKRGL